MIETFNQDGLEICDGIICKGVARAYYEQGFPLAAFAKVAKENDLRISWLNVAREFMQQGFTKSRVISEFRELIAFHPNEISIDEISEFCELDDEAQKEKLWEFWQSTPQFAAVVKQYRN